MAHHAFPNGEALARNLADDVAAALERRLNGHGAAGLVVSGGRTPAAFLRELGSRELDWSSVFVTLADERRVAADDPASNLRLLRQAFAGNPASAAMLVAIDATGADAASRWSEAIGKMPRPFAAVILGMGNDGHFASLFPGMPGLATALDLSNTTIVVEGIAPVEPRARLSLTLSTLLDTELLVLHVTGEPKLATLRRAAGGGSALEMPVRALLTQDRVPLRIYNAP
ncbi:MAG: 6-phosphogluconolactonase [Steroidobacteraceae bacterium]|nr:6-phosphogluconolactonase [Steroidobacteraceae bacterium]MBP7014097.1 6-phosphogluconolactonase [Steroidobacteraceae bacterium]